MALSKLAFKIIRNAVQIRISRGETDIDSILNDYSKLSEDQKKELKEYFEKQMTVDSAETTPKEE
jgi:hypothetical protein